MIEVKDVSLIIKEKEILKDINADFEKGMIHGLIGRNGSGKTMLMKTICGFVRPTRGTVTVDGLIIGKDRDFPDKIGVIIETPSFIPEYSGYQNLKNLADFKKKIGKQDIIEVIKQVGLDPFDKKSVKKYSLGMRQRLGIAQAIMEKPDILILDEPMNGLDQEGVDEIRKLLLNLKEEGKTILISSHSRDDIDILCDRRYMMSHGNLTKL